MIFRLMAGNMQKYFRIQTLISIHVSGTDCCRQVEGSVAFLGFPNPVNSDGLIERNNKQTNS